jgi:phosphatidylinositol alpha-1,6-mannosyltransferase
MPEWYGPVRPMSPADARRDHQTVRAQRAPARKGSVGMRVVVTVDARYQRTPDGAVWTQEGPAYPFWTRYLNAFDTVRVIARVKDVPTTTPGAHRVNGDHVHIWPLPYYVGPRQYLRHRTAIGHAIRTATTPTDAVILRVPSPIGSLLATHRERQHLPYALEVVADPHDVYAPGVIHHPARPWLRHWATNKLRHECQHATAVGYVTQHTLQNRYPANPHATTTGCSDVELAASAYAPSARGVRPLGRVPRLVSVGSLKQPYKGIDTLLKALAHLHHQGTTLHLTHIGDGRHRPHLQQLAHHLGITHQITFTGWLPAGPPIRHHLDNADLFVMPSRTEGLPRALIEAMARALPAIATHIGGIPELLPPEDLVPPNNPTTLATTIHTLTTNPHRMATTSARNLTHAHNYSADTLNPRRNAYYHAIATTTRQHTPAGSDR